MRKTKGKGPTSKQRLLVWRGELAKTTGGLTKADLVKNKRGKIVSRKKSAQSAKENNLGSWLRKEGKTVAKKDLLRHRGDVPKASKDKPAPSKKSAGAPAKKVVKKRPVHKKKFASTAKAPKGKPKQKLNPLTGEQTNLTGLGYSKGGNIDTDNIIVGKRRRRKRKL